MYWKSRCFDLWFDKKAQVLVSTNCKKSHVFKRSIFVLYSQCIKSLKTEKQTQHIVSALFISIEKYWSNPVQFFIKSKYVQT